LGISGKNSKYLGGWGESLRKFKKDNFQSSSSFCCVVQFLNKGGRGKLKIDAKIFCSLRCVCFLCATFGVFG